MTTLRRLRLYPEPLLLAESFVSGRLWLVRMWSRFPGPKRPEPRSRSHGRAGGWRVALQSEHFRPGLCPGHSAQWESVKITRHFGGGYLFANLLKLC